ncbi:MAG: DUF2959 domain-containing protein [Pseudohongiellaceae bacterium]
MKQVLLLCVCSVTLVACESAYYATMERFGMPKREILVDRIEDAQEAQQDGQELFVEALEQFRSLVDFDGGELETHYERLNAAFEDSESAANRIHDRIDAVESVAEALFDEWEDELDQYTDQAMRRDSEQQLLGTRDSYSRLMTAMHSAEQTLDPVLDSFRDNVLYLRHNLNAQAITSLRSEYDAINTNIEQLILAMERAIAESNRFIAGMRA